MTFVKSVAGYIVTMKTNTKCPHYVAWMVRVETPEGFKVVCECGWVHPDPTTALIWTLPPAKLKRGFKIEGDKVVRK